MNSKKLVDVTMIVDESGSMKGLQASVLGHFGLWMRQQLADVESETLFTLVTFADKVEMKIIRLPLSVIGNIDQEYNPTTGYTALYQGMGETIEQVINRRQKAARKADRTVIITMTDGHENASRGKYSGSEGLKKLFDLINEAKDLGFEFGFFGAEPDTFDVAGSMGIDAHHTATFGCTEQGIEQAFGTMTHMTSSRIGPKPNNN